jgi:hypothetical protein
VQASMFTKHMLFIGFSLVDPNFNTIADTVKIAMSKGKVDQKKEMGTSIQMNENPRMSLFHFLIVVIYLQCLVNCGVVPSEYAIWNQRKK